MLAVALLILAAWTPSAHADLTPDEVVVSGFGEALPASVATVLNSPPLTTLGVTYVVRDPFYTLIKVPTVSIPLVGSISPDALVAQLSPLPGVRFAERNTILTTQAETNDPLLDQQGYLGQLAAKQAWDVTQGQTVTLGVVDSGVELSHPDLAPNLLGQGLNVRARDGSNASDVQGHGTEVAGAAAARGANGIGIAGVAWASRIVVAKVTDDQGLGTATDIADGVRYALAGSARVINVSMAGPDRSQALDDAIAQAQATGVLVVVAAGNQARDIDASPAYPASYTEENVVGVAATDAAGNLAAFSNRGAGATDIAAPGVDVATTGKGGQYVYTSGTSIASPLVAGMAGLLAAVHPDWGPGQLRARLLEAASGCRKVAGVASGELCAPPELRSSSAGGVAGGGGSGGAGGSGSGAGAGSGSGAQGGSGSSSSAARVRGYILRPSVRRRGARYSVRLRWRLTGRTALVRRVAIKVDKGRVRLLKRTARSATTRLRRGRHRLTIALLDGRSRPLFVRTFSFRVRTFSFRVR